MSFDLAIQVSGVVKNYEVYDKPADRLKQFIMPRIGKILGYESKAYFRPFNAVEDVSFQVKRGQTVGIIGRNGSGKSTLLQMICGTLNPTRGVINSYGRIAALLELGSGFNPEFTGRENVYLNASILGLTREQIERRFDDIAAFADIGPFIEQPVKTYSSGMMVRLAFSVIAHVDADILVIDEALAVGDAFFTQKCMRFLREFMQTKTVLFVSHDTSSIKNLCTHAIWMDEGKIMYSGSPKEVCDRYLEAFYEAQQGKSTTTKLKTTAKSSSQIEIKDQRQEFINASNLRNDIKIFKFDPNTASFGLGGAQIEDVRLLDDNGSPLGWVVGGEKVILRVNVKARDYLGSPIVGFYVKDPLGQSLFGDNTFLTYRDNPFELQEDEVFFAEFVFQMPLLPSGSYSVTVAIANGTQDEHQQHHWIHDAVTFKSEFSSVSTGIVGIPMQEIKMTREI